MVVGGGGWMFPRHSDDDMCFCIEIFILMYSIWGVRLHNCNDSRKVLHLASFLEFFEQIGNLMGLCWRQKGGGGMEGMRG